MKKIFRSRNRTSKKRRNLHNPQSAIYNTADSPDHVSYYEWSRLHRESIILRVLIFNSVGGREISLSIKILINKIYGIIFLKTIGFRTE